MSTTLRKAITRVTVECYNWQGRPLVVSLLPGDVLSMREKGSRKNFVAPLSRVYQQLVDWNVAAERADRKRTNRVRRGLLR